MGFVNRRVGWALLPVLAAFCLEAASEWRRPRADGQECPSYRGHLLFWGRVFKFQNWPGDRTDDHWRLINWHFLKSEDPTSAS